MKIKIITTLAIITAATTLQAEPKQSGFFIASNKTDHKVTIKVGNFVPTSYTLSPHSSKTVVVSSNNQNIEISDIS